MTRKSRTLPDNSEPMAEVASEVAQPLSRAEELAGLRESFGLPQVVDDDIDSLNAGLEADLMTADQVQQAVDALDEQGIDELAGQVPDDAVVAGARRLAQTSLGDHAARMLVQARAAQAQSASRVARKGREQLEDTDPGHSSAEVVLQGLVKGMSMEFAAARERGHKVDSEVLARTMDAVVTTPGGAELLEQAGEVPEEVSRLRAQAGDVFDSRVPGLADVLGVHDGVDLVDAAARLGVDVEQASADHALLQGSINEHVAQGRLPQRAERPVVADVQAPLSEQLYRAEVGPSAQGFEQLPLSQQIMLREQAALVAQAQVLSPSV